MPDITFLQDHSLIPPCAMVSLSRLMLFSRLLVFCEFHILSILHAASARHKAWLNAVWEDLQFLTTADKFIDCNTWNMSQWVAYITTYVKAFRTAVRSIMSSPHAILRFVPQHIIHDSEKISTPDPQPCKCALCTYTAPTRQQPHFHKPKSHCWMHPSQFFFQ